MIGTDQIKREALRAIVAVGDGRGFVVQVDEHRYVITAAHCLPDLPPACAASYEHERTYGNLLGPLGGERTVRPNANSSIPSPISRCSAHPTTNRCSTKRTPTTPWSRMRI